MSNIFSSVKLGLKWVMIKRNLNICWDEGEKIVLVQSYFWRKVWPDIAAVKASVNLPSLLVWGVGGGLCVGSVSVQCRMADWPAHTQPEGIIIRTFLWLHFPSCGIKPWTFSPDPEPALINNTDSPWPFCTLYTCTVTIHRFTCTK